MRWAWLTMGILIHAGVAAAATSVQVSDAYLELHTGPGAGYPVTRVVKRGEQVKVLKQRTDWYKLRDATGHEGWVSRAQLSDSLTLAGNPLEIAGVSPDAVAQRHWEVGALGGDFSGAEVMTLYGGYAFNPGLALELKASQVLGNYSSSTLGGVNLTQQPFPHWRVAPFVTLGMGVINTQPRATLVRAADRTDPYAQAGLGMRLHLTGRFILRAEYLSSVIFASDDYNEEIKEWKAGFCVFF